ncbi:arylesterase [Candidatus Wolfebacteria bacterium]|nr:MAG: arylesterase [Candidatus Wolfebacteria bacterium]
MNIKSFIRDLFVLAVVASIVIGFINKETNEYVRISGQVEKHDRSSYEIIAFGDSLVKGFGVLEDKNFTSLLEQRIGIPILNKGIIGDTTETALERLEEDLLFLNPQIVIVLIGGNDVLHYIPVEQTFDNIEHILEKITENGATPLLVGIRGGIFIDRYKESYEVLVTKTQTRFVPDILSGILFNYNFMFDFIHPNARGHEVIADRLEPEVRRLIREVL